MSRLSDTSSPSGRNPPKTDYSSVLADTTTLPSFKERLELIRKRTRPAYEAADRPPIGHLGFRHRRGGRPNAPDADDFDDSLSTLSYHTQSNFSLLDFSQPTPQTLTEDTLRRHDRNIPRTSYVPSLPSLPPPSPLMVQKSHTQTHTHTQPPPLDTAQWIEETEREQRRLRKGKDIDTGPSHPPHPPPPPAWESPIRASSPSPLPPPSPPAFPPPASISSLPTSQIHESSTARQTAAQTSVPFSAREPATERRESGTKVPERRLPEREAPAQATVSFGQAASTSAPTEAPVPAVASASTAGGEAAVQTYHDAEYPPVEFDDVLDFEEDVNMDQVEQPISAKDYAADDIMDFGLDKPPPSSSSNALLPPDSSTHDLFDEQTRSKRITPNHPANYSSRFLHDRKHRGHYMLPRQIVRKVISKFTDKTITTQGNERINQVTSMFFEQVMGDLNAYAEHAGRDVVISGDVELLMHRQGQLSDTSSVEALAHDFLPRELYDRICVSALANNELYPDKEDDWI